MRYLIKILWWYKTFFLLYYWVDGAIISLVKTKINKITFGSYLKHVQFRIKPYSQRNLNFKFHASVMRVIVKRLNLLTISRKSCKPLKKGSPSIFSTHRIYSNFQKKNLSNNFTHIKVYFTRKWTPSKFLDIQSNFKISEKIIHKKKCLVNETAQYLKKIYFNPRFQWKQIYRKISNI